MAVLPGLWFLMRNLLSFKLFFPYSQDIVFLWMLSIVFLFFLVFRNLIVMGGFLVFVLLAMLPLM